jgi:tetratricopeptide (TPR) repeat protein
MANPYWKLVLPRAFLLVMAGFWVFLPALGGDWLWDDTTLITENYNLRTVPGLEKIWSAAPMTDYWPLTWTLLWIEWHLWKNLTFGYHVCSLALHLLSGFLVWQLFARLGLRWAWFGGLLFIIHPLAVESVAWISEIKNTLSLPFFLLSLNAYLDYDEKGKGYLRSLLYYLAAMLGKASVIMLPAVLLLYVWWKRGQITRRDFQKTLPFFGIALVLGAVTLHLQGYSAHENGMTAEPGFVPRLLGAAVAIAFYLGKFLDPTALMPVYPRWALDHPSLLELSTLPLLFLFFLALWNRHGSWDRHALLGLGFFALTLLPVLDLFHLSYLNISPVADHFVYLPMIGLIGLVVAALEAGDRQLFPIFRSVVLGAFAAWTFLLAWQAHGYAAEFVSGEKLWTYALNLNPGAVTAHDNLGLILLQSGRVAQAKEQFAAAARIDPSDGTAHNDLGVVLLQTRQLPEAITEYETALRCNPRYAEAHDNLALAQAQMGGIAEAIAHEQAALQIDPDDVAAHEHLGDFFLQAGQPAEAEKQYALAAQIDPEAAQPAPVKK